MNRTLTATSRRVGLLLAFWLMGSGVTAAKEDKRELLAEHEVLARFESLAYRECMGMTSECPDRCGNSGDFASFAIIKYLSYNKPGKYGDAKTESYTFQLNDNMLNHKVPLQTSEAVRKLAKDDYVLLSWRHDYVTKNNSSSPERTVTLLRKLTPEAAAKFLDASGDESPSPTPPQ